MSGDAGPDIGGTDVGGTDADVSDDPDGVDPATALHEHLAATETLPVKREAGWYLGEAQALAGDVASGELDGEVARERAAEVRELLAAFGETGDSDADDHVAAARKLADRIAGRPETGSKSMG